MGTAGHGHCALETFMLWDLDPRSLPASWHSQDTAFWFSETPCLQAIRLWAVKNDMQCPLTFTYAHTGTCTHILRRMHLTQIHTRKSGGETPRKTTLYKRNREVWRKKYVGVAGGGWGWSHGRGCHSSNVRFMFCGPSEFSNAKVGSISLA